MGVCHMIVDTILTGVAAAASPTPAATKAKSAAPTREGQAAAQSPAPSPKSQQSCEVGVGGMVCHTMLDTILTDTYRCGRCFQL